MLIALLVLAAAPDAPVEQLSLTELRAEELRLEDPPSYVPGGVVLGVGCAATLVAIPLGVLALNRPKEPPRQSGILQDFGYAIGTALLYGFAIGVGVVAGLLDLIGGGLMGRAHDRREEQAQRLRLVRVRIDALSPPLPTFLHHM